MSSTNFIAYQGSGEQQIEQNVECEESVVEHAPSGRSGCPECENPVISEADESYCVSCGLVLSGAHLDAKPTLRGHGPSADGGPNEWSCETVNPLRVDKGLHTTFFLKRDGNGNSLSSEQMDKYERLRQRHKRFQIDKREIRLNESFREIESIVANVSLPQFIVEVQASS